MTSDITKEILSFLRELRDNNNREWFQENREQYVVLKEKFDLLAGELIDKIAAFDGEIKGVAVKDCVYRIYRDLRFSPNRLPYKTHFAVYIAKGGGRNSRYGGYYMHIEPDGCFLSGGIYCPEPALLKRLRQDVYDNVEEFKQIITAPEFVKEFKQLDETDILKKVPAPFSKDFPDAGLLKHKHYIVSSPKPDGFFESGDIIEKSIDVFKKLCPFNRFLNYTVEHAE